MTSKHRITVNLDDAEYEAFQRVAIGLDRSLSWLGRRAICKFVEQQGEQDIIPASAMVDASKRATDQAAQ